MRILRLSGPPLRPLFFCGLMFATGLLTGCSNISGFTMNRFGTAAYNSGNDQLAMEYFQRAIIENPTQPDHYSNLATVQWRQKDYISAEANFQKALRLDPLDQQAYHGLSAVLVSQGRTGDATALLEGYAAVQPQLPQPQVELAWLKRRLGDSIAAEQHARRALAITPKNPQALTQLAMIHQDRGQTSQAVALYRRSLDINANQSDARAKLAQLSPTPAQLRSHNGGSFQMSVETQMAGNIIWNDRPFTGRRNMLSSAPTPVAMTVGQPTPVGQPLPMVQQSAAPQLPIQQTAFQPNAAPVAPSKLQAPAPQAQPQPTRYHIPAAPPAPTAYPTTYSSHIPMPAAQVAPTMSTGSQGDLLPLSSAPVQTVSFETGETSAQPGPMLMVPGSAAPMNYVPPTTSEPIDSDVINAAPLLISPQNDLELHADPVPAPPSTVTVEEEEVPTIDAF